jgi:hypothetical protein
MPCILGVTKSRFNIFSNRKGSSYYYDEIVWLLQKQFHKPEPLPEKLQLKLLLRPEKKRKRSIRQNENGKQWLLSAASFSTWLKNPTPDFSFLGFAYKALAKLPAVFPQDSPILTLAVILLIN